MKDTEQRKAAKQFAEYWKNKGYEKGESQPFWLSLLRDIYGVEHPEQFIHFEDQVKLDNTSFIDGMIPDTHVMIEQKALGKNLMAPIRQSDGSILNPFQQAKRYSAELPYSQRPRWIITCNFSTFNVYDMERPGGDPEVILLENLEKEYYRLNFLVDKNDENIKKELDVSLQAGEIVGVIYDALLEQYADKTSEESLKSLNMLCVRLVFCLYAEDAGIFGKRNMFHDYMKQFPTKEWHKHLAELFKVLDTKKEDRYKIDKYMEEDLNEFPYVNGGLFENENIEIPRFTDELVDLILNKASINFDWSMISPTIFGAVFESTLNQETRRSGGMHYTSIENIHKVIDPLFLDELKDEYKEVMNKPIAGGSRTKALHAYQDKLASLTFLDPACGSGNFLTETYISLRRLENKVILELDKEKIEGQLSFSFIRDEQLNVKVSIQQFYGIEINDFAVAVAKTALWIAEAQMLSETKSITEIGDEFLPLKTYTNIVEENALRMDWENVIPATSLNYIMGNPPFVGARLMDVKQKADLNKIFKDWKNAGNLDYVSCWYKKSLDYIKGTNVKCALVSTNSISQGEIVANLWKGLFEEGITIDFAHRTFRWDSEASTKAHVHCVIIGFSNKPGTREKIIYDNGKIVIAKNINAYLNDAPNIFVESRTKPLCQAPTIGIGNKPIDGGYYLFKEEEKNEFIKKEPQSEKWFRQWLGAEEFINRKKRYCLWLGECTPSELRTMPECMKRVKAVRDFRLSSRSKGTVKLASTPTRFHVENRPKTNYLLIPRVSSEKRRYVPIGYIEPEVLCGDSVHIIAEATKYHFGVLISNVHMSWMRAVCGRLETRYRYSKDIVYNNFPWPIVTDEQKLKIEQTAQAILDARTLYPDSSLADLYDELCMPPELRKAHQANDKAVMEAYGFWGKLNTETECVAELMKMYKELT